MRITEDDWVELEAQHHDAGVVTRRLFPCSAHDIFLGVQQPTGRRMLIVRVPATAAGAVVRRHAALPRTRGLELEFAAAPAGQRELRVVLTAEPRREVFNPLISDMATTAQEAHGHVEALTAAVERFEQWRSLLQTLGDTGLSAEARQGLYGELIVLRDHLMVGLPVADAVHAWTGPTGTDQDFQLPQTAIEVKTSAGRHPRTIVVTSERQLDETGCGRLLLAHLSIDERRGGSGESLNAVIDTLRPAVAPPASILLDELLVRVGYLNDQRHLYDEPQYTLRDIRFWHVMGDFPRIVEADLRSGVGDCRYRISTVALEQYRVPVEEIAGILRGET